MVDSNLDFGCGVGVAAMVCEGAEKVDDVGSVVKCCQRLSSDAGFGCGVGVAAIVCEGADKVDDVGSVVKFCQRFISIACTRAQQQNTDEQAQ